MLTISFILHFILLVAVYYLIKQVSELQQTKNRDLTQLFEKYLNEIKEENKQLQLQLENNKTIHHPKQTTSQKLPKDSLLNDSHQQSSINERNVANPIELEIGSHEDQIETSLQAKILQLHQQGLTIEQIAKHLNCGKTEAELIIEIFQQKNS